MKFLKATLRPKKSHPDQPESFELASNEYKTAKAFSEACIETLKSEGESASLWFAPKIERITEQEYVALMVESEDESESESMTLDFAIGEIAKNLQIEHGTHLEDVRSKLETVSSEAKEDPDYYGLPIGTSESDVYSFFVYMTETAQIDLKTMLNIRLVRQALRENYNKPRINNEPHQQENAENEESDDLFYWFQYTPTNPIIVRIQHQGEKFIASYKFESESFVEIDKLFEKKENAIIFCLGMVIDDCNASPSQEHNAIIKGIGNRNPETAIIDALMTPEQILEHFGQIQKVDDNYKPWEQNPEIEYQDLYSAIVDVTTSYDGEHVPAASDCYKSLVEAVKNNGFAMDEAALVAVVQTTKNPHNFTNQINATQIAMNAHPKREKTESEKRLADKFEIDCAKIDKKNITIDECEPETLPAEPEKPDFGKQVEAYNEKIEALAVGECIIFDDMPNEIYHACVGISSSKIKDAMRSMMYFNAKHNTKEIEQETGSHFDIGNVFHSICLEPDLTSKEYICEPSGNDVPAKPTDTQLKKYNDWVKLGKPEKSENPKAYPTDLMLVRCGYWGDFYESTGGLYPVAADDWRIAENMAKSAINDTDASKLLKHPARKCERSYFKRCDETGMIIKARPDLELGRIVADLKSIALRGAFDESYLLTALRKEVFNRQYHLSAAMYLDICEKSSFIWIFTNKQDGYHWTATIRASSEILERGRELYKEYKHKIAACYDSGNWPKPESITSKINPETDKLELPEI